MIHPDRCPSCDSDRLFALGVNAEGWVFSCDDCGATSVWSNTELEAAGGR